MQEIISKADEYFRLQYREKIEDPNFLNYICDKEISGSTYSVAISHKALKHFVESRKESFTKNLRNCVISSHKII